jgi:hypothetical protein
MDRKSEHHPMTGPYAWIIVSALLILPGCALEQEISRTPRTAVEQLLLGQALERALDKLSLPIPEGASLMVEVSGFQTDRAHLQLMDQKRGAINNLYWDFSFVRDATSTHLGELGYRIRTRASEATYLVRVMVQSLGTNQGLVFFGMPAVQSMIIPFALPELTLYRKQNQLAYARIKLDIFEMATGRLFRSTPWWVGEAFYNQYTILFFIFYRTTDLSDPP